MYTHILIATDGSELAGKGIDQGLALAKQLGAKVTIVTVTEKWSTADVANPARWQLHDHPIEEYEAAAAAAAKTILDAAAAVAAKAGVPVALKHVKDRLAAEGIIEAAAEAGCDLVVMTSHGRRGLGRLLLGSQTTEVLTHSKIPVLVVR